MNDLQDWIKTFFSGVLVLFLISLIPLLLFTRWEWSEDIVSGIVYDNTNNAVISGKTNFKIRASVDTYVSEDNVSRYCLPKNSPYIPLVNEAAADKSIKVVVKTRKGFWFKMPWTCIDNVTVEKQL